MPRSYTARRSWFQGRCVDRQGLAITGREVSDDLFERLQQLYDEDAIEELTAMIAWENCSSKFNRALRIPSRRLWKRSPRP
jgi:hypothetical protein